MMTSTAIKISRFQNPRWWWLPSLKIKNSQYLRDGWTSFDNIWHDDVSQLSRPFYQIKFCTFKNLIWSPIAIWEIEKNHDISKTFAPISAEF